MKVKSESEVAQLCLTLRDPMDYSLPGSSAHGIFQTRVLEWVATAFSDNLSLAHTIYFLKSSLGISNFLEEISAAAAKSLQSCPTLCDPIDSSPSCSTIPGILQARTLEQVAISFSNA